MITKNQVIAGFDRGAKTYTKAAEVQAEVAETLSRYFADISARHILEIGCGTGLLTEHLAKAFPDADFCLTDISPSMIAECRQHMTTLSRATWVCMDGENPETLPDYDLIVSSMTLHWFDEFEAGLHNLKLKLKPGGRLLFSILSENSFHEWQKICRDFDLPIATPRFPAMDEIKKRFPGFDWHVQKIKKIYPNAHAFLRTLKRLGAIAPRREYVKLATHKMRHLLRDVNHDIEITYEVVYGEYHAS
ncbi:MAG TPA: methyltransferase [Gammaproteobacteria bacterium]|nr:methyltransferase [Gammaproteobacteria bacterium]